MDRQLVQRAREGDQAAFNALAERYDTLLRIVASRYYGPGLTRADLMQEARIGLFKAVRDYTAGPFEAFVWTCVSRNVITAVKAATRGKHGPLNDADHLDAPLGASEDLTLADTLPGPVAEPVEILAQREEWRGFVGSLDRLSPRERTAVVGILNGQSYDEIGERKEIDNALQRARRKLADPPPTAPVVRARVDHPRVARTTTEILNEASAELMEREQRLLSIQSQTKAELDDVRQAIKRLGGKSGTSGKARAKPERRGTNGSAPSDLHDKIIAALKGALDPLTSGQIGEQIGLHPAGVGAALRSLEAEGKVERVDTVNDKHVWGIPQQLDKAVHDAEVAVAMSPEALPA